MYFLTQQNNGDSIAVNTDSSLLEQCLAKGISVARSCRNGNCGRCDVELLSGRVILRTGSTIDGPNTVPLCLASALSDLLIDKLPLAARATHWRCQQLDPVRLHLPAGRQSPPHAGDRVAVFLLDRVVLTEILSSIGREITIKDSLPKLSATIGLLLIDHHWQGEYSLWRENTEDSTCLWSGINDTTAKAALIVATKGIGKFRVLGPK